MSLDQTCRASLRPVVLIAAVATLGTCVSYQPPQSPAPREGTQATAPFDSTWSAVVSYFASRNLSIRTIEKASGIIVAEAGRADLLANRPVQIDANGNHMYRNGKPVLGAPVYADCGTIKGPPVDPITGAFNVFVRANGAGSIVKASVRYTSQYLTAAGPIAVECVSLGKWESELEALVKEQVERNR